MPGHQPHDRWSIPALCAVTAALAALLALTAILF